MLTQILSANANSKYPKEYIFLLTESGSGYSQEGLETTLADMKERLNLTFNNPVFLSGEDINDASIGLDYFRSFKPKAIVVSYGKGIGYIDVSHDSEYKNITDNLQVAISEKVSFWELCKILLHVND